jgi:hypothetical protein
MAFAVRLVVMPIAARSPRLAARGQACAFFADALGWGQIRNAAMV